MRGTFLLEQRAFQTTALKTIPHNQNNPRHRLRGCTWWACTRPTTRMTRSTPSAPRFSCALLAAPPGFVYRAQLRFGPEPAPRTSCFFCMFYVIIIYYLVINKIVPRSFNLMRLHIHVVASALWRPQAECRFALSTRDMISRMPANCTESNRNLQTSTKLFVRTFGTPLAATTL